MIQVRGCCVSWPACYVEVIRNTPVLLQIFIVYFAFPSLGIRLAAVTAGIIALGVNVGAYLTEVVRAGFSSVERGQMEAAQVLGLSRLSVFTYIVAPQALRNVYPSLVNNLIQVLSRHVAALDHRRTRDHRCRDRDQRSHLAVRPGVRDRRGALPDPQLRTVDRGRTSSDGCCSGRRRRAGEHRLPTSVRSIRAVMGARS